MILKSGLIDKKKGLFARRRMFLLTEGPRLYYVDPVNLELKGEILITKELRTEAKNFRTFFVHTVSWPIYFVFSKYIFNNLLLSNNFLGRRNQPPCFYNFSLCFSKFDFWLVSFIGRPIGASLLLEDVFKIKMFMLDGLIYCFNRKFILI